MYIKFYTGLPPL